jgi:hypothetical protein
MYHKFCDKSFLVGFFGTVIINSITVYTISKFHNESIYIRVQHKNDETKIYKL